MQRKVEGIQRARELRQSFVEVVHLSKNTHHHDNHKHIRARMRKLVSVLPAGKCQLDRNSESLRAHDGERPHGAANRDVNERVLLAVFRRYFVNHYG